MVTKRRSHGALVTASSSGRSAAERGVRGASGVSDRLVDVFTPKTSLGFLKENPIFLQKKN